MRLLCPTNVSPASSRSTSVNMPRVCATRPTALRKAWPSKFKVSSTRPAPNSGVESRAARSCRAPKPPVCSRQRHGPIEQRLVQVVRHEPQTKVEQRALAEGRLFSAHAVQHHLPALVHDGEFHRIPVADVAVRLQQQSEGQQSHFHRGFAGGLWALTLGQRVLKVRVEEFARRLSRRKTKNCRVLRVRAAIFCSSRVNASGGVHMMGSSRWQSSRCSATYQITPSPILSTPKPLSKQLISVLGCPARAAPSGQA